MAEIRYEPKPTVLRNVPPGSVVRFNDLGDPTPCLVGDDWFDKTNRRVVNVALGVSRGVMNVDTGEMSYVDPDSEVFVVPGYFTIGADRGVAK